MSLEFNSSQEEFWASEFGDNYISRNMSPELSSSNIVFFSRIISSLGYLPKTFLELGANIGMNIKALQSIFPGASFTGIEINKKACELLSETGCKVIEGSILEANIKDKYEFVFSKGVLIHVSPDQLNETYKKMYECSSKNILIAEYYNPNPVAIPYRGNFDKLFKRDFAGEFMDLYPDLILRDYGFAYHRGAFPQDDITWFLLEKKH